MWNFPNFLYKAPVLTSFTSVNTVDQVNKLFCKGQIMGFKSLQEKISNYFPRKASSLFKFYTLYLKMEKIILTTQAIQKQTVGLIGFIGHNLPIFFLDHDNFII